jgi:hypothetical protein
MGFLGFLNHWWNLPFLVMLGLVGVFFALQIFGLFGDHDHDVDADHDLDADADHDVDADHDADHDADGGGGWQSMLAFFGIGRVPFMVVWTTLFIFTGFTGIFCNRVIFVNAVGTYPSWAFFIVLMMALLVGAVCVKLFGRLAAKFVDTGGKGSTQKHELAGRVGVVASAELDQKFGEVRVQDSNGTEILIHGRLQGEDGKLARGDKVVLVDFDESQQLFWVTACPDVERSAS